MIFIGAFLILALFLGYVIFVYREPCGPPVVTNENMQDRSTKQLTLLDKIAQAIRRQLGIQYGGYGGCPICLAGNTLIDTPSGLVPVKDLQVGMPIWTTDKAGHRVSGVVAKTSKVSVSLTHQMVHLALSDGRELLASSGHPTVDGRTIGDLASGDLYDGVSVTSTERVSYGDSATYDVLPSGDTGFYWANSILIGSTLR